jgi:hypothetical protein
MIYLLCYILPLVVAVVVAGGKQGEVCCNL